MKVSVSLPADDVEFLDGFARSQGYGSRSAVVHKAVTLLRSGGLVDAYADAWQSWAGSADAEAWDAATPDGLQG